MAPEKPLDGGSPDAQRHLDDSGDRCNEYSATSCMVKLDAKENGMKKILIIVVAASFGAAVSALGADAASNFKTACAKCHGATGKGDTKMGQKLGIKDMTKASIKDDEAFKAIKEGVKAGGKTVMKPAEGLSDADIKALVDYVKTLK
jgi:cytochrome c553